MDGPTRHRTLVAPDGGTALARHPGDDGGRDDPTPAQAQTTGEGP